MNRPNHIRASETQKVVISLQIARMVGIQLPAEIFLLQLVPLNHRPHRPVHHHNPLPQRFLKLAPPQGDSLPCFHGKSLEKKLPLSTNISAYHDISMDCLEPWNLCLGQIRQ